MASEYSVLVRGSQRAALENIRIVLEASGSNLERIVKMNVYMANLPRDFKEMNEAYLEVRSL